MKGEMVGRSTLIDVYGGTASWRLPYKQEALSLIDHRVPAPGPAIASKLFLSAKPAPYWIANAYIGDSSQHWFLGADSGYAYYADSGNRFLVRCVSGKPPLQF